MTPSTICFCSSTGGELGVVSQCLDLLGRNGLDQDGLDLDRPAADGAPVILVGRTREQVADPARARAFARTSAQADAVVVSLHGGTASCPAWQAMVQEISDRETA